MIYQFFFTHLIKTNKDYIYINEVKINEFDLFFL